MTHQQALGFIQPNDEILQGYKQERESGIKRGGLLQFNPNTPLPGYLTIPRVPGPGVAAGPGHAR